MKKFFLYVSALAATIALAASCQKEIDNQTSYPAGETGIKSDKTVVFTATSEKANGKTTIGADGTTVEWASGDVIDILWDGGSTTSSAASAGSTTTFEAEVDPASAYYAVYPASVGSLSADVLSINVPTTQDGTFASSNIAVAKTDAVSHNLSFYNATALVKFSVSDAEYNKAVFAGTNGEAVAGEATIDFGDGTSAPTVTAASTAAKSVEVTLSGAGDYYFAVLPGTFSNGFSITLFKNSVAERPKSVQTSRTLGRATILDMGAVDGVASITDYFVKPSGTGSGKSWDKAMGPAQLKALLETSSDSGVSDAKARLLDGVTIHMAAGDYYLAGEAEAVVEVGFASYASHVSITFKGGYPATLTGTNTTAARDTSVTAFTGNSEAKILHITDNANITFDGITFKNSNTTDSEHAALGINSSSASVTVQHCTFKDNKNSNTGQTGAAITLVDGTLTISDCSFTGNTARNAGALFLKDGKSLPVRVSNCKFESNTSTNTSGAAQNAKWTDVQFSHCSFINNVAQGFGGGAFHTSTGAVTIFEDCVFTGNSATATGTSNGRGGAVSLEQTAEASFTRCVFSNNTANCGDKSLAGEGKSAVENNVAGGAIVLRHAGNKLTLNACSFSGNTAPNGCGGVIGAQKSGSTITVNDGTTFTGNESYFQGGVIFTLGNLTVNGTATGRVEFKNNKTLHTTRNYSQGGAIWVGGSTSESVIKYALFDGNDAGVESSDGYSAGGALRAGAAKKVTVENCEFTNNRGANGNAFSYSNCVEECVFTDCIFHDNIGMSGTNKDGNASRFYGGVGEMTAGSARFERCTFKDNLARSHSGVLHFNNNGDLTPSVSFTDCLFDGNSCLCQSTANSTSTANNGGGCFKFTDGMMMTLNRCVFKNNQAHNRGAVFQLGANDVLFMNQVTFTDNNLTATGNIWGVNIHSNKSVICMNNVTSFNNSAPNAGTHYSFNSDGGWIITNSTLIDNCTTGVVRANNTSGNGSRKSVFCNNVIINRNAANSVLAISTALTSAGHNLLSCSSAPANLTMDASDVTGVTSLNGGSYSSYSDYLGQYSWTNNLSGFDPATAAIVEAAIKSDNEAVGSLTTNIGQDFYDWLSGINALGIDGRGEARTGAWWPGAYQAN